MERLSSLDGVFLAIENRHTPMNIGSVAFFEGSAPSLAELQKHLDSRIDLVPRCRQRVREPRGPFGRPLWIDDVHFDVDNHIQAISVQDRAGQDFADLVADLLATYIDRRHPLWRVWLVDHAAPNRWALVTVVHHCLVDGIAGNDLLTALLSSTPEPLRTTETTWRPITEPSAREVLVFDVRQSLGAARVRLRSTARFLAHPRLSWRRLRTTAGAAKRLWYRQHHVTTSLVGPIGPQRRWRSLAIPLQDIRTIQSAVTCTVNDVVLAAVTNGLRDLLVARRESIEDRTVTAMVPVSLRTSDERGTTGNRIANVHAHLPVGQRDPLSTLRMVHAHVDELKTSHEVDATGALMNIGANVPRVVADRIARAVVRRQRNVETAVTNVPGPRDPLYVGPHQMVAGYPVAPIAGQVRITIAIWSYCDTLSIGITGDRDTTADLDVLVDGIRRGVDDLRRSVDGPRAR